MGAEADANEKKRQQHKIDQAAFGPKIFDRYGRPILLGCQIEFHSPLPIAFEVLEAKPDLRPEAKPGVWILTLGVQFPLITANNLRMERLTVVGYPEPETAEPTVIPDEAVATPAIVLTDAPAVAAPTPPAAEPPPALRLVDSPVEETEQ